jgi:carbon-monoxide dehydrogenase large subunit
MADNADDGVDLHDTRYRHNFRAKLGGPRQMADAPNMNESLIGRSVPRSEVGRLITGRGRYTDDIVVANAGHVAFLRSPHAHAHIKSIDVAAAKSAPGVVAVITADDLAPVCKPWQTRLALIKHHVSPPQFPLAGKEVCWQGEAVAAVVAETRAQAEDAVTLIRIQWLELSAVATLDTAASPNAGRTNSAMANNLGLDHAFAAGDTDAACRDAAAVVEHDFVFARQTGVTLEGRAIVAEFDPRLRQLTIHHSHQVPHQMRDIFAAQLDLPLAQVRVIAPDVGGAFGMKLSAYPDELAVAAIAVLLMRPVKFTADRSESFVTDAHAREAQVHGRLAVDAQGRLLAMDVSSVSGFGAYTNYPRGSVGEGLQTVHLSAAAYRLAHFRGQARGFFQNKVPSGVLRGVGHPLATTVTEQLLDLAARKLGIDPAELRRQNYAEATKPDAKSIAGIVLGELSLDRCHDKLLALMNYSDLRQRQTELRKSGVYRGIGLAVFIEQTAVGPSLYGALQVRVSANEACRLTLEPDGSIRCETSITDQGQGTRTALTQIIAQEMGADIALIDIASGDTATSPMGGGAWASRGAALGGEAALRAARKLKHNVLTIAGSMLQSDPATLRIEGGTILTSGGLPQMKLADIAAAAFYRSNTVPLDEIPPLEVLESYAPRNVPYIASNGIQAAHVEIDPELGSIRVLDFWVVEDCGRAVNPRLVDEQIRGGVAQGIGSALYEECIYSADGQLQNGNLADYLVPMSGEMPNIAIAHVETPTRQTALGARGVGEAGTVAAGAAIWCAVNDALSPFGAVVTNQPITPEHVRECLSRGRGLAV